MGVRGVFVSLLSTAGSDAALPARLHCCRLGKFANFLLSPFSSSVKWDSKSNYLLGWLWY